MGETRDTSISLTTSLARSLAFSPVPFAVTEGPTHALRFANSAFRRLQSRGEISIGRKPPRADGPCTDLTPLLDRAFVKGSTVHDEVLAPDGGAPARWGGAVWA